jgi:hypothetical protein
MAADKITVRLAHPLSARYAAEVFAESKEYLPGDAITLPADQVLRLANAGLVQGVDPNNAESIRRLFEEPKEPVQDEPVKGTAGSAKASLKK